MPSATENAKAGEPNAGGQPAHCGGDQKQQQSEGYTRALVMATIVIAATAVINVGVLWVQWGAMRENNRLTREAAEAAERPWVLAKEPGPISLEVGQPLIANVDFENVGKAPAFNFRLRAARFDPYEGELPEGDAKLPRPLSSGSFQSRGVLGPGLRHGSSVRMEGAPTAHGIDQIMNGDLMLYAYGLLEYDDAFGNSHETAYCFVYGPEIKRWYMCANNNHAN